MWYYLSIYKFFNLFTLNQRKDMKIPPFFQKKSTIKFRFIVKIYLTSVRMDLNGDGQITADEEEVSTGTYTVDGNYIYLTIEGETEKAELRDGKIVLKVTDWDGESIPMEFILEQV